MKQTTSFWRRFFHFLHDGFVLSNTVFFIFGLALSYTLVRKTVVDVLMDFLTEDVYLTLREAIVLMNMLDLASAVFRFGVAHLEAYTGPFSVIIFCTAAYTMGLMLLWLRTWLILATVLVALGKTGAAPLRNFFDYQLRSGEKCTQNDKRENDKKSPGNSNNLWRTTAYFTGFLIAVFWLGAIDEWSEKFKVSSLVMGSTHLLFFCGSCCYDLNASRTRSPLTAIYEDLKAAIIRNNDEVDDAEGKKKYEEQVRDVKSFNHLIPLSITFFAYSLTFASGNTYFVMQSKNLNPKVGGFHVPVVVFFALKSLVAFVVKPIRKLMKPTWSIAVGMFCSGLCCIAALLVEKRRLYLIKPFNEQPEHIIPLSIMVLTPQYFLLGLMEGFAEFGVEEYLRNAVPESMIKFVGPGIQMLLAIGNFSSVLSVLIFHSWIKDYMNHSHLDRYFLMLVRLNFVFFGAYVCCVKFKLLPQFDKPSQANQGTMEGE